MNPFYKALPEAVEIDGALYPIATDFRDIVQLMDMLQLPEAEMPDEVKKEAAMQYFTARRPPSRAAGLDALWRFVTMQEVSLAAEKRRLRAAACGEPEQEEDTASGPAVLSYRWDAGYIYAAFLAVYRIDIFQVEYLHWWAFRWLLEALPGDTEIKQRMAYRGTDASKIKDKAERRRVQRIKNEISLPQRELADEDIGSALFSMI